VARILVVDDEPDILLMLRMNLEGDGHECVLAADGQMALERIQSLSPDLVLLDVMMPVLDGWSVLEQLQRQAAAPPVVVVSAKSAPRDAVRALELGAVEYVTKPFDLSRLMTMVRDVVVLEPGEREARRQRVLDHHRSL